MSADVCPGCGTGPGGWHARGCDVEQCPYCGGPATCCDRDDDPIPLDDRLRWTGLLPGEAEARTNGWYCMWTPRGWRTCRADDPRAMPDLDRVDREMTWDRDGKRFLRKRHGARGV